jgi:hypothetical protein
MLAMEEANEEAGVLRSIKWVAPMDSRKAALCGEAVVMIGEKPETLANWMAGGMGMNVRVFPESKKVKWVDAM